MNDGDARRDGKKAIQNSLKFEGVSGMPYIVAPSVQLLQQGIDEIKRFSPWSPYRRQQNCALFPVRKDIQRRQQLQLQQRQR